MKKVLLGIICGLLVLSTLTGCGKSDKKEDSKNNESSKITCTMTSKDDSFEAIDTAVIEHKDNKVTTVEQTSLYKINDENVSEDDIKTMIKELEEIGEVYKDISGYEFSTKKISDKEISITLKIDYSKVNLNQIKEKLGDEFINTSFPDGLDVTVDQVKKSTFEGFECK